jgi:hypothetical protein
MPSLDHNVELNENIRGTEFSLRASDEVITISTNPASAVLGQDPLIPPQLLQAEIPAVWHRTLILLHSIRPLMRFLILVGRYRPNRRQRSS